MRKPATMDEPLPELIPTRKTLLSRLKNWNDQASWKDFFDTYWRLIYTTARKAGLTDAEAQEAVQETVISVCKKMPDYKYDPAQGSFKAWLLQLTRWRIVDELRKRRRELGKIRAVDMRWLLEQMPDDSDERLNQVWDEEWERHLVERALASMKGRVNPKHYQVFHLMHVKQWSAGQVAERLKISRASAYLIKHRVSRMFENEVRRLNKES